MIYTYRKGCWSSSSSYSCCFYHQLPRQRRSIHPSRTITCTASIKGTTRTMGSQAPPINAATTITRATIPELVRPRELRAGYSSTSTYLGLEPYGRSRKIFGRYELLFGHIFHLNEQRQFRLAGGEGGGLYVQSYMLNVAMLRIAKWTLHSQSSSRTMMLHVSWCRSTAVSCLLYVACAVPHTWPYTHPVTFKLQCY